MKEMKKIEVHIKDEWATEVIDVTGDPEFNVIVKRNYDRFGQLQGGIVISRGRVTGHVDPKGDEGTPGPRGYIDGCFGKQGPH